MDASVVAPALMDDGPVGDAARQRLLAERIAAPSLLDLEVMSVLRRAWHAGHVDERRGSLALQDLLALPVVRAPHEPLLNRIWELRGSFTPYDAAYVALAEAFTVVLLTADRRLARAAAQLCDIELMHAPTERQQ
ncbi:MAG TPA: type II toxin-antitoxin system VapC family toxin [Candidatus Sulfotelmatobacter sp.]|nr:type II toxin-antitoxin system VapC family toxin [Candidatus Sulfotelmatobacter sp.]